MATMSERLQQLNPFSKRDSHSEGSVNTYRVLTLLSWLLAVVPSIYYSLESPEQHGKHVHLTIWGQNSVHRTGFTQNAVVTSIFWIVLWILQVAYAAHLFSSQVETKNAAVAVGSHFVVNNLLHFGFVMLFVRSHFVWAEVLLVLNLVNLTALYLRHSSHPRFIHAPVVSGPLAWTFVALYWNGAMAVPHQQSLVARVFANVFIWSILAYGAFFLAVFHDYTMGFALSVLSASIGVGQFLGKIIALQWIFAFTIMALLFVATVAVAVPAWSGKTQPQPLTERERTPLLGDEPV